ncbi:hypothetical protein KI387_041360 [Taxus chinensis]|uniref:Protein kinase domain-containing protein n=1 Tax=Taxus chinensis TaxID=29808 RepID=A0AA38CAG1_TAXCH|nr:hypothetical protein KI387_041360 [Taxus chinensis]
MKAGTYGPVIDNVSVMKIKKKHDSLSRVAAVAVAISVAVAIVGAAGVIFFMRRANSRIIMAVDSTRRQNHRPNDDNPIHIRTYAMWEVLKATDNFTNKVGEGGFGVVYRVNLEGNSIGAVKRATKRGINNQQIFKEELSVLLRLNHPNLVNLIGLCFEKEFKDEVTAKTQKVVVELLKGAGKIHWVGAPLSVVGFVLARFGQMSSNQSDCLALLKDMFNLGKHILQLND